LYCNLKAVKVRHESRIHNFESVAEKKKKIVESLVCVT